MKRVRWIASISTALVVGPLALPAFAQSVEEIGHAVDEVWLVVAAALVFLMQAGFALVEAGFTRAKNAANIVMKNVMDFAIGSLVYWLFGFGLAYGGAETANAVFGWGDFALNDSSLSSTWLFQVVFAATAATIVSGAMAERTKFSAYLIYTPFITGLIYPVVSHWVWDSSGWLAQLGYIDFAGSSVVHLVGAVAGLAGTMTLGPRIGKYINGQPQEIQGHSLILGALGMFILWFGWYGFNAGSTLAAVGQDIASVAVTTTLAASAGALGAMITAWGFHKGGKPDVAMTLNGSLAGLVGITAGTAAVSNLGSVFIGVAAGTVVVYAIFRIEAWGIDDPVGAISVHGVAGIWGVLAVGLFSMEGGLFYGGGLRLLAVQAVGLLAITAWVLTLSLIVFWGIKTFWGLRVTQEEEIEGLDHHEHGALAYPEFH
jgi:Amt family ammonium transporter